METPISGFVERSRDILEKLPISMGIFNFRSNRIGTILVTDELCRMLQQDREALSLTYRDHPEEAVHPADLPKLQAAITVVVANTVGAEVIDVRLKLRDRNKYMWHRLRMHGELQQDGGMLFYAVFMNVNDIYVEAVSRKAHISDKELLLETILNTTQIPIYWKGPDRRFLGANAEFLDYYGFASLEEILGKTDDELDRVIDPAAYRDDELSVLEGVGIYMLHGKCIRHGEMRDIISNKTPVYQDGALIGYVGSFIDVTDTYRQEQKIADLEARLDSAQEELRSEKQSLHGKTEQLKEKAENLKDMVQTLVAPKAKPKEDEGAENADLQGKRVLIVEDNKFNADMVKRLLEKEGVECHAAYDGLAGYECFRDEEIGAYDMILMDIQMPVMDGYDATARIRALAKEEGRADAAKVPIVAMSADVFKESANRALESGMDAYLSKPLNVELLYGTMREMLQRARN